MDIIGSSATGNVVVGNSIEGTTPSPSIQEFSIPQPYGNPDPTVVGPDGDVWFTELTGDGGFGTIAKITPAGQIIQIPTPLPVGGFLFGPDGNIWFGGHDYIGEMTCQGVLLADYHIASADDAYDSVAPTGVNITLGPDGNIWYTEPYVDSDIVGKLTPSGQVTEYPDPVWPRWR